MLLSCSSLLSARATYRYSYIPKQIYATQIFPVTIFADTIDSKNPPKFYFDKKSPIKPINKVPIKDENGKNIFFTFYFKALNSDVRLPNLTIVDEDQSIMLLSRYIPVQLLDSNNEVDFCGLIATDCKIVNSQVSTFDSKSNLITLTIKATEANVDQIRIKESTEEGIEKLSRNGASTRIEYYFVIPSSIKEMTLSYFNTIQNRFIDKKISTDYQNKPVAAQENLNPIDSSFNQLKKYGFITLTIIMFLMFLRKKEFLYLILFLIGMFIIFNMFKPHQKICITEGSPLYILPTSISTIGGHVDRDFSTDILNTRGNYYKIEYDNGVIGWIKNENICKD